MVVTDDEEVFEKVSLLKFHGMDRNAWKRFAKAGSPRYDIALPGYKYNMMDIQAALGLHQLPRLDGFIERRRKLAEAYQKDFRDAPLLLPEPVPWPSNHAWHLYTPLVNVDRAHDRPRPLHGRSSRSETSAAASTTPPRTSSRSTATTTAGSRTTSRRPTSCPRGSSLCPFSGHDRVREAGRRRSGLRHRPEVPQVRPRVRV